jgi:hypothetical protein
LWCGKTDPIADCRFRIADWGFRILPLPSLSFEEEEKDESRNPQSAIDQGPFPYSELVI